MAGTTPRNCLPDHPPAGSHPHCTLQFSLQLCVLRFARSRPHFWCCTTKYLPLVARYSVRGQVFRSGPARGDGGGGGKEAAVSSFYTRIGAGESEGSRSGMEHTKPRGGGAGLHQGLGVAQPDGVFQRQGRHQGVSHAQMGAGAGLPADERALGLHGQPYCGAL